MHYGWTDHDHDEQSHITIHIVTRSVIFIHVSSADVNRCRSKYNDDDLCATCDGAW